MTTEILDFSPTEADTPLPTLPARAPFVAGYHRQRWTCCPDGKIRPDLAVLPLEAGQGNIGQFTTSHGAMYRKIAAVAGEKQGYTLLHPEQTKVDGRRYLVAVRVRHEGRVGVRWSWAWERLMAHSALIAEDYAMFDRFLASWQAAGILPAQPDPDIVAVRLAAAEELLTAALNRAPVGHETTDIKAAKREVAAWQAMSEATADAQPAAVGDVGDLSLDEENEPPPVVVTPTPRRRR